MWPSTQAGWWRYQSASSYVRAYGLCVLRARGRVCGRWFCGVSAVDSRRKRIIPYQGFNLVKLNCSISFSIDILIVSKKIDDFLRQIVRLEILL